MAMLARASDSVCASSRPTGAVGGGSVRRRPRRLGSPSSCRASPSTHRPVGRAGSSSAIVGEEPARRCGDVGRVAVAELGQRPQPGDERLRAEGSRGRHGRRPYSRAVGIRWVSDPTAEVRMSDGEGASQSRAPRPASEGWLARVACTIVGAGRVRLRARRRAHHRRRGGGRHRPAVVPGRLDRGARELKGRPGYQQLVGRARSAAADRRAAARRPRRPAEPRGLRPQLRLLLRAAPGPHLGRGRRRAGQPDVRVPDVRVARCTRRRCTRRPMYASARCTRRPMYASPDVRVARCTRAPMYASPDVRQRRAGHRPAPEQRPTGGRAVDRPRRRRGSRSAAADHARRSRSSCSTRASPCRRSTPTAARLPAAAPHATAERRRPARRRRRPRPRPGRRPRHLHRRAHPAGRAGHRHRPAAGPARRGRRRRGADRGGHRRAARPAADRRRC